MHWWVQRVTPLLIDAVPAGSHLGGIVVRRRNLHQVSGVWSYVYRAVDQRGQVIDVNLS